jgi:hypothetical protein
MIGIAINLLWILIGVIIICAVIYFVFYVLKSVMMIPIPDRVEQAVWLIVLILVIIALLTLLAGGGSNLNFPRINIR